MDSQSHQILRNPTLAHKCSTRCIKNVMKCVPNLPTEAFQQHEDAMPDLSELSFKLTRVESVPDLGKTSARARPVLTQPALNSLGPQAVCCSAFSCRLPSLRQASMAAATLLQRHHHAWSEPDQPTPAFMIFDIEVRPGSYGGPPCSGPKPSPENPCPTAVTPCLSCTGGRHSHGRKGQAFG